MKLKRAHPRIKMQKLLQRNRNAARLQAAQAQCVIDHVVDSTAHRQHGEHDALTRGPVSAVVHRVERVLGFCRDKQGIRRAHRSIRREYDALAEDRIEYFSVRTEFCQWCQQR